MWVSPQDRTRAVRATIRASTSRLSYDDAERFAELALFAEDEIIPFSLVARLWRATAGLEELRTAPVCPRLSQLALVSQAPDPVGSITLDEVVRDFLRAELGPRHLAELARTLLDTVAADPPAADPLDEVAPRPPRIAWWEFGDASRYLWTTSSST
jgi:hypothetical protein